MSAPSVVVLSCTLDELRALVAEAVRNALAARAPEPSTSPLVDRRELARLLSVSAATVTRLTAEGMPVVHVGDSPRYHADVVRAWLGERGKRGTTATPRRAGPIAGVRLLTRGGR